MAYTSHGHHIDGTIKLGIPPRQVARCGGPRLCRVCQADTLRVLSKGNKNMLGSNVINERFGFHKARIEGPNANGDLHTDIRVLFKNLANELDRKVPDGRAKSIAFTELESASMWFHKALAALGELEDD